MARLIDADALKEFIDDCGICAICPQKAPRCSYDCDFPDCVTEKWNVAIDAQPTVDAVSEWIPFEIRPTDDEEREYFKSDTILDGKLPDDGDGILVSKGKYVWADTFVSDELGAWLDGYGEIEDGMAWMPLPKPYEETDHEE